MSAGKFSVTAIFKAKDMASRVIAKMEGSVSRFARKAERDMRAVDGALGRVHGSFKTIAVAAAAAGAAIAAGLAFAAKPGMDFEQQMANLGATSLQTRDQIADLEKEALRLGAATQFSATEVGAAMEAMAKAGFTNTEILDGIAGMTYAAAASGEELAATTEQVSSVMKGMGLATSEAARVADVLALASVRTNSSISSLGESMSKVSSTARQLKVPLEDTVAMVALLQDVGLDASEAGSATATMLTMMAKPTDAVAAKMKKMGVSFKDSAGNMLAPAKVLGQLVKAGQKAGGNMDQVAFFADLVGMRGQKAAVNLKDLFAVGKVTELVDELKNASGTAEKMSKLRMNTFTGDLDILLESVKGYAIELFALASGPLRDVTKGMTAWIDANKQAIVTGIVGFVKKLADNFEAIVTWATRIAKAVAVFYAVAAAVKVATLATMAWNAVAAANPITLIIMGIIGALALLVALWPEISKFFKDLWSDTMHVASEIASSIGGFIQSAWAPVKSFLIGAFEFVVGALALLIAPILPFLQPVFELLALAGGTLMSAWGPVKGFFASLWSGGAGAASSALGTVIAVASSVFAQVKELWAPIGEFFSSLWAGIAQSFQGALGWVFDKLSNVVNSVRGVGRSVLGTDAAEDAATPAGPGAPQVVSPQERAAAAITEHTNSATAEVTIKDETGRAAVTKKPRRGPIGVRLAPSGAF